MVTKGHLADCLCDTLCTKCIHGSKLVRLGKLGNLAHLLRKCLIIRELISILLHFKLHKDITRLLEFPGYNI